MKATQLKRAFPLLLSLVWLSGSVAAQTGQPNQAPPATLNSAAQKAQLVALHVDQNDPAVMNLALNNAQNIIAHYKALGRPVKIEIVTYGPGLYMLRDDKSPVKARISTFAFEQPEVTFIACANTRDNMAKAEGTAIAIMPEAKLMPSGVVHLMELQASGYAYIKP